jgi:hypothetical protein
MMNKKQKTKLLLKILIGTAWIDGVIQPQERDYLQRMAHENAIADEPDIKPYLSELKPIKPDECYHWLEEYLGDNPKAENYQGVLEAISGLIYSDGEVQTQEAIFLDKIQHLDPIHDHHKSIREKLLETIQKLYRKAINEKT